jgi:hypothetical protein
MTVAIWSQGGGVGAAARKAVDIIIADWLEPVVFAGALPLAALWMVGYDLTTHADPFSGLPWYACAFVVLQYLCQLIILSLVVMLLVGGFILQPVLGWAVRRNGAPFAVGDRVMILRAQHYGHVAVVESMQVLQGGVTMPMVTGPDGRTRMYRRRQLRRVAG